MTNPGDIVATMTVVKPAETEGWSPKVYVPGLIQVALGVALIVAGVLVPDDTLKTLGYAALGTGITTLGIGRAAGTGNVKVANFPYDPTPSHDEGV